MKGSLLIGTVFLLAMALAPMVHAQSEMVSVNWWKSIQHQGTALSGYSVTSTRPVRASCYYRYRASRPGGAG